MLCLYQIIRKEFDGLRLLIIAGIVCLILYLPVNGNAGGIYFTGFWSFENFISQPYLKLSNLELARRIFIADNKILKSYFFESIFILVTIFSFFGSKIIGVVQSKKSISLIPFQLHIFLLSGLVESFILGFFFQQTSGGSNTFNFIVNVFIVGSVYTALSAFFLTSLKKPVAIMLAAIIIGLTVPRVVYETYRSIHRLINGQYQSVTPFQLRAFDFLRHQTRGRTLVDRTVFGLDASSPYIAFFVDQPMYLSGVQILESHGLNVFTKSSKVAVMMDPLKVEQARNLFLTEKIEYFVIGNSSPIATVSAHFS